MVVPPTIDAAPACPRKPSHAVVPKAAKAMIKATTCPTAVSIASRRCARVVIERRCSASVSVKRSSRSAKPGAISSYWHSVAGGAAGRKRTPNAASSVQPSDDSINEHRRLNTGGQGPLLVPLLAQPCGRRFSPLNRIRVTCPRPLPAPGQCPRRSGLVLEGSVRGGAGDRRAERRGGGRSNAGAAASHDPKGHPDGRDEE